MKLKDLQGKLSQEVVEVEKEGTKVALNGSFQVQDIVLNSQLSKENQERVLKECFREAFQKIQTLIAQKMAQL